MSNNAQEWKSFFHPLLELYVGQKDMWRLNFNAVKLDSILLENGPNYFLSLTCIEVFVSEYFTELNVFQ